MRSKTLSTVVRAVSLVIVSLLIGVAMARFILIHSGEFPLWIDAVIRHSLEALGVDVIGIEDMEDMLLLETQLACWIFAALVMFAVFRFSRGIIKRVPLTLALLAFTFICAHFFADWLNDTLLASRKIGGLAGRGSQLREHLAPFTGESDNLSPLYIALLISVCWLGMLACALGMVRHFHHRRVRSPPTEV
jgi:hypothetical protein